MRVWKMILTQARLKHPENDFWYDRLLDLKAEYDDQNGAQLEAMNGGEQHA